MTPVLSVLAVCGVLAFAKITVKLYRHIDRKAPDGKHNEWNGDDYADDRQRRYEMQQPYDRVMESLKDQGAFQ